MRFILFCAFASTILSCRPARDTRVEELLPDIVIGEVMSFTGPDAAYGYAERDGIELALRQFNEEGGVHGRRIVARVQDDRNSVAHGPLAFERVLKENPIAVIGATSSNVTIAMASHAQKAKIPLITPSATSPKVTAASEYVFRSCFQDDFQGHALATFAFKQLNKKAVAILHTDAGYSTGLAEAFARSFKALGGVIVADESFAVRTKDVRPALKAIAATKPDALLLPMAYEQVAPVLLQAREVGLSTTLLGGDGWDSPRLAEITDGATEGAYFSAQFAADSVSPAVQKFVKDFSDAFGYEPNGAAAMGYEAGRLVVAAARRVNTLDGPSMREALANTTKLGSLAGETTMTATRDPLKPAFIMQVKNGAPKFVTLIQP